MNLHSAASATLYQADYEYNQAVLVSAMRSSTGLLLSLSGESRAVSREVTAITLDDYLQGLAADGKK